MRKYSQSGRKPERPERVVILTLSEVEWGSSRISLEAPRKLDHRDGLIRVFRANPWSSVQQGSRTLTPAFCNSAFNSRESVTPK
jgi:hypothetical protein